MDGHNRGIAAEKERPLPGAQELAPVLAELKAIKDMLAQLKAAAEATPHLQETMRLRTAAPLYDVSAHYLRVLCTRGDVEATLIGGKYYVTSAAMDRVFKGASSPLLACRPKPEAIKGKLTLKQITKEYGVAGHVLMASVKNKSLSARKINRRWFIDRSEVERVFGTKAK
jgi:hypothetical protein